MIVSLVGLRSGLVYALSQKMPDKPRDPSSILVEMGLRCANIALKPRLVEYEDGSRDDGGGYAQTEEDEDARRADEERKWNKSGCRDLSITAQALGA